MKTDQHRKRSSSCCDGIVVKVEGDKLTCACSEGDDQCYTLAKDVDVTCNGDPGEVSDLCQGTTVRMTMCEDDETKVVAVECEKPAFA